MFQKEQSKYPSLHCRCNFREQIRSYQPVIALFLMVLLVAVVLFTGGRGEAISSLLEANDTAEVKSENVTADQGSGAGNGKGLQGGIN